MDICVATDEKSPVMSDLYTTDELEASLGEQIRAERLRKNMTMQALARASGISVQTLRSLEEGNGGRVESLIRVARALGRTSWLESFRPPVTISPMQMLKGKRVRLRASKSTSAKSQNEGGDE